MNTLEELLTEQIQDLYDAEKQLVKALPKFAKAASNEELKQAFQQHLEVTKGQVERLEEVFGLLEQKPKGKPCAAMKGLLEEGQEILSEDATDELRDSAMIGAAQKVEHYEIAGYGTVRTLAEKLQLQEIADLLQQTLDEEKETDEQLTVIAGQILDEAAGDEGDEELEDEDELEDEEEEEEEETATVAKPATKNAATKNPATKKR